jgi:hypothetical protein
MTDNVMKKLIDKLIVFEWAMFDKVQNEGGRALCQDDYPTFDIMRRSQFEAWNTELLESYLSDLATAKNEGRNLVMEKYAYMMEYTAPEEFMKFRTVLPLVSDEKKQIIRRITDKNLVFYNELAKTYPLIAARGRPEYTGEEIDSFVSVETYLLGELATYSDQTLRIYVNYIDELVGQGKKLPFLILENTVRRYGFASLDEAEERMRLDR